LTNLQTLNLSNNRLTEIPPATALAGNLPNLNYLYLNDNRISELSGAAFAGLSDTISSISLQGNNLYTLPDDISSYGSKLDLQSNCMSTRDSSPATISYMQSRYGSSWESNQYLCLKGATYDPANPDNGTTLTGPVVATLSFYGPANREAEFISSNTGNQGNYRIFTHTFYDNGEFTFNLEMSNYYYNNSHYIKGKKILTTSVDWMDGPIVDAYTHWTRSANNEKEKCVNLTLD
jgi:hypothetical protein